ncbi:hypothetical protein LIER_25900 [Lithospermum erythrorhizon]|uniref:Reverse transcriptase/retrotransposon-derived protein RNase H-like domain-containing protein n=1 Tax=Lithospermum erythrorhizon TaxID=34254 RepID=A0AAV3R7T2_LITER
MRQTSGSALRIAEVQPAAQPGQVCLQSDLRKMHGYMINQRGIEPNPDKIAAAIKKGRDFEWTPECEKSFQDLKAYLQCPHLLAWPLVGDVLQLYLAVSDSALSSVLIREEEKVQRPVYYVSRVIRGAETRYPLIKKLVLALILAAQKLKPYFEAHPVEVVTHQPLRPILESLTSDTSHG